MPIRGSDKCYRTVLQNGTAVRHGEANCVSLEETMNFAKRIHAGQAWIDTILVTSEEKQVVASAYRLREQQLGSDKSLRWTVLTNEDDIQQGTGRSAAFADEARHENNNSVVQPAIVTESILKTLTCQVLPAHHIVLMRSSTSTQSTFLVTPFSV